MSSDRIDEELLLAVEKADAEEKQEKHEEDAIREVIP